MATPLELFDPHEGRVRLVGRLRVREVRRGAVAHRAARRTGAPRRGHEGRQPAGLSRRARPPPSAIWRRSGTGTPRRSRPTDWCSSRVASPTARAVPSRRSSVFDPSTNQASPAGTLMAPRAFHTATPARTGACSSWADGPARRVLRRSSPRTRSSPPRASPRSDPRRRPSGAITRRRSCRTAILVAGGGDPRARRRDRGVRSHEGDLHQGRQPVSVGVMARTCPTAVWSWRGPRAPCATARPPVRAAP